METQQISHFIELNKLEMLEAMKGAFLSSIQTENLTIAFTDMQAGVEIPLHHHIEEAIDVILEGELEMEIDGITAILKHGMISIVPSNVPHKARAITTCKVVTVFYPKRGL